MTWTPRYTLGLILTGAALCGTVWACSDQRSSIAGPTAFHDAAIVAGVLTGTGSVATPEGRRSLPSLSASATETIGLHGIPVERASNWLVLSPSAALPSSLRDVVPGIGNSKSRAIKKKLTQTTSFVYVPDENGNGKPPKVIFHFESDKPVAMMAPKYKQVGGRWTMTAVRYVRFDESGKNLVDITVDWNVESVSLVPNAAGGSKLGSAVADAIKVLGTVLVPQAALAQGLPIDPSIVDPACVAICTVAVSAAAAATFYTGVLASDLAACIHIPPDPVACAALDGDAKNAYQAVKFAASSANACINCLAFPGSWVDDGSYNLGAGDYEVLCYYDIEYNTETGDVISITDLGCW